MLKSHKNTHIRTYIHTHCVCVWILLLLTEPIYLCERAWTFWHVYMPKTWIFATLNFTNLTLGGFYYCKYLYVINFGFPGISWNFFISRKLPGKHPDFPKFRKFPSKWKHWSTGGGGGGGGGGAGETSLSKVEGTSYHLYPHFLGSNPWLKSNSIFLFLHVLSLVDCSSGIPHEKYNFNPLQLLCNHLL